MGVQICYDDLYVLVGVLRMIILSMEKSKEKSNVLGAKDVDNMKKTGIFYSYFFKLQARIRIKNSRMASLAFIFYLEYEMFASD